jgi:hypothetical protein
MSNYIIDTQAHRITLLDARFYFDENGKPVPSVTTILEAYPKDAGYFKFLKDAGNDADTIRDEAGRRGSIVHELTERYDRGEEVSLLTGDGWPGYKMLEWSMFERYVDFSTRFEPEHLMIEQNFVSSELGFAGTIDRVMELGGKRYLVDIKTSNAIYDSYWLQLAAYRLLYNTYMADRTESDDYYDGVWLDGVAILWLNAKTRTNGKAGDIQGVGWQMVIREDAIRDLVLFNHTHALWLAQNKGAMPKQFTYTLTHQK